MSTASTPVPAHEHSLGDLPVGPGAGKIPSSDSIRTGLIAVQSADSNAIASTAILTAFTGAGTYTLPANTLRANEVLEVNFLGTFGITGTPTLSLSLSVGGVVRAASNAVTLNAAGNWSCRLEITQLAAGAARMAVQFTLRTNTTASFTEDRYDVQGLDPTIDNIIVLSVLWGTSSASNTTTQVYRTVSRRAIFAPTA